MVQTSLGRVSCVGHLCPLVMSGVMVLGCSSNSSAGSPRSDAAVSDATAPGLDGGRNPIVTGPITGGRFGIPYNSMPAGLADQFGYYENELFIEGTAQAYAAEGTWDSDGRWAVSPATTAHYKTRILVRRPSDPKKFNGTVFVEWLNVSIGADADVDFAEANVELLRGGYAYVGVSAQRAGVEGGGTVVSIPNVTPQPLKQWDPDRYGSLVHPGDEYSYDIFSQAGALLRGRGDAAPLSGLTVRQVIASGDSQSASRLVTYVNAVHPVVHVFDGFLLRSRPGNRSPVQSEPVISAAMIRTDLTEPVMQFETESDLFGPLNFFPSRQPDTAKILTWEVAGTSHADQVTADYLKAQGTRFAPDAGVDFSSSCGTINSGPQTYVLRKAVAALTDWVAQGAAPAPAEPFELGDGGTAIARDAHGNALGGVRTPAVDVPIATLLGDDNTSGSFLCFLFGSTKPLDTATLATLYPTHADYAGKVITAAQAAVDAGHLLAADQALIVQDAESAAIPQ